MTRCQPTHPVRTRPPRPPGRSWSLADYQEDPDASRPGWAAAGVLSRGQLACLGQRQALLPWYRSCRTSRAGRSLSPVPSSSCSSARWTAPAGAREPVGIIQDIAIRDAEGIHTARKS